MRLTNDGIKEDLGWFEVMPGSKTQHHDVIASDEDARDESVTVTASTEHNDIEVQYAMATAGYHPTVSELGGLMLRSPEQFAAAEVAVRNTVEESAALAAVAILRENVELDASIAA
jgi:hypothetical protein